MNKHHISLELNKVLALLTEFTTCEDAKYLAEHLEPETNLALAKALLGQTEVNFVLDNLASMVPAVAYNVGDETIFTINIKDELGQTCVKSIKFITVAQ